MQLVEFLACLLVAQLYCALLVFLLVLDLIERLIQVYDARCHLLRQPFDAKDGKDDEEAGGYEDHYQDGIEDILDQPILDLINVLLHLHPILEEGQVVTLRLTNPRLEVVQRLLVLRILIEFVPRLPSHLPEVDHEGLQRKPKHITIFHSIFVVKVDLYLAPLHSVVIVKPGCRLKSLDTRDLKINVLNLWVALRQSPLNDLIEKFAELRRAITY